MLPTKDLVRPDGTRIAEFKKISVGESLGRTAKLFTDWRILLMLPTFFVPEMHFPLASSINGYAYSLRARSLNATLGSFIQIPTTFAMGWLLDNERLGTRKRRAFIAITVDAVWITGVYIAQTIWLHSWNFDRAVPGPSIDVANSAYAGGFIIYMFYLVQYGIFQNVVIWIMGTLSNDPYKQASMGGLFVGGKCNDIPPLCVANNSF
jgi:hypothetical protein